MIQIHPYLRFNGDCKEAMTTYQQLFGGELAIQIVGESPMAHQWPASVQQSVLHASLTSKSFQISGSDMFSDGTYTPGNAMALSLQCTDETQFHQLFKQLSEGGKVIREPHAFFAGMIGVTIDRFGKEWMFYFEK